jgi:hypothetical protein
MNSNTNTIESVTALFSGAALLAGTNESAMRQMKSGLVSIASVTNHESKKGAQSVKICFDAIAAGQDGHDEYLRTSSAENLKRSLNKLRYMFKHANVDTANAAINALPNPFVVPTGEDSKPIIFTTNDELEAIRATHGEDTDWLWLNDGDTKERVCVTLTDPKAYCDAFIAAVELLKDAQFYLQVKAPSGDDRFQRLEAIKKPMTLGA